MGLHRASTLVFNCLLFLSTFAAAIPSYGLASRQASGSISTFDRVVVANSVQGYTASGTLYARSVQLADSSLLTTFENYSPEPPNVYFPIYRSTDYGNSWTEYARVEDTQRNYGLRYQPTMYVLPGPLGDLPAGTLLLAGSAIPTDLSSTHIELYASCDNGQTWSFISHIADGGRASTNNGETPVWEPFMLYHNGQLIVYYSDQRDPAHGQKMVHQVTSDGLSWGPVVNDVAEAEYNRRPGMPVVAQLQTGDWILMLEDVNNPQDGNAPVYYKISNDPLAFGDKPAIALVATNGAIPRSSPYVVVTETGRVIVSGGQGNELYVNDQNADAGAWRAVSVPQERAYTRALTLIKQGGQGKEYLMITGGGWFGSGPNQVVVGILDPAAL